MDTPGTTSETLIARNESRGGRVIATVLITAAVVVIFLCVDDGVPDHITTSLRIRLWLIAIFGSMALATCLWTFFSDQVVAITANRIECFVRFAGLRLMRRSYERQLFDDVKIVEHEIRTRRTIGRFYDVVLRSKTSTALLFRTQSTAIADARMSDVAAALFERNEPARFFLIDDTQFAEGFRSIAAALEDIEAADVKNNRLFDGSGREHLLSTDAQGRAIVTGTESSSERQRFLAERLKATFEELGSAQLPDDFASLARIASEVLITR